VITIQAMNVMTSFHGVEPVTTAWPLVVGLVGVVLVGLTILIVSALVFDGDAGPLPPSADAVCTRRAA